MKKYLTIGVLLLSAACTRSPEFRPFRLELDFRLPGATKVTDTAFEPSDQVGLWITESDAPLQVSGNFVNNVALMYDGTRWNPSSGLFWPAEDKPLDIYAYYPFTSIASVTADPFVLPQDQHDGFSGADFLWAKAEGRHRTSAPVLLVFSHRLSKVTVRLEKGKQYEGDLPQNAEVYLHETITEGQIDYTTGSVTTDVFAMEPHSIRMHRVAEGEYEALVIPQRLDFRSPFLEVIGEGISYLAEGTFNFLPGVHHVFTLVLNTSPMDMEISIDTTIENDWN